MTKLIFSFIAILILGVNLTSAQDIVTPSPLCKDCPEWAKSMTQFEWESWKEQDRVERENVVKVVPCPLGFPWEAPKTCTERVYKSTNGSRSSIGPNVTGLKAGSFLIGIGALLEVIASSTDVETMKDVKRMRGLSTIGFLFIGVGGVTMSWNF